MLSWTCIPQSVLGSDGPGGLFQARWLLGAAIPACEHREPPGPALSPAVPGR